MDSHISTDDIEHIGDVIDVEDGTENLFVLSFLPLDIFDNWDRCGDIADFIARYFHYNFKTPASQSVISTVINELAENAVKYSRNKSSPIRIEARKRQDRLILRILNSIPRNQREHFTAVCRELFDMDLETLYLDKLTQGKDDRSFSGIGLILLKKDYDALIGFDFRATPENTLIVEITLELCVN